MKKLLAITTYNRLSHLNRSIESLLECTADFDELVIADDHSSDGTIDYLVELSENNPKIHVTVADKNSGVCELIEFLSTTMISMDPEKISFSLRWKMICLIHPVG
jgi:hypothetical protein